VDNVFFFFFDAVPVVLFFSVWFTRDGFLGGLSSCYESVWISKLTPSLFSLWKNRLAAAALHIPLLIRSRSVIEMAELATHWVIPLDDPMRSVDLLCSSVLPMYSLTSLSPSQS